MQYPRASTHIAQCPTCGLPMSLSVQLAGCRCRLLAWSPIRIALAEPTELRMSLWSQREQNHRKKRIKAASIGSPIIIPTRSVIGAIVSGQRRH